MRRNLLPARRIRKGPGIYLTNKSVAAHTEAVASATSRDDRLDAIQAKVCAFEKKYRQRTSASVQHFDWLREHATLRNDHDSTIRIISASLASLADSSETRRGGIGHQQKDGEVAIQFDTRATGSNDPSTMKYEIDAPVQSITQEVQLLQESIAGADPSMSEQRSIVKSMLVDLKSALLSIRSDSNDKISEAQKMEAHEVETVGHKVSPEEGSPMKERKRTGTDRAVGGDAALKTHDIKVAYFAELLLHCRESLSSMDAALDTDLATASKEASDAKGRVIQILQEKDRHNGSAGDEGVDSSSMAVLPTELRAALGKLSSEFCRADNAGCVEISILQDELVAGFQKIQSDHDAAVSQTKAKYSAQNEVENTVDSCSLYDGWNDREHDIFAKVVQQWKHRGMQNGRKTVLQRLTTELPSKTRDDLVRYWDWWDEHRTARKKRKEASEGLHRRRQALLKVGLKKVEKMKMLLTERAERAVHASILRTKKEYQRERLRILREERDEAARVAELRKTEIDAKRHIAEEQAAKLQMERQAATKEAVREYQETLKIQAGEIKSQEKEKKGLEELERLQRMKHNKKRINHRDELRREQSRMHEAHMLSEAKKEKELLERLSALAASVPYFDAITRVTPDIHRTTVARTSDVFAEDESGLADFQRGVAGLRSFTNERVFSDARFRLGHALHEAGVSRSAYARAVVKKLVPREAERTTAIEPF